MYSQYVTPQSNVLLTNRPNLNDEKHQNVSKTMFQKGLITMEYYAGFNVGLWGGGAWLTDTGTVLNDFTKLTTAELCEPACEQPSQMDVA